jgi:phosphoglycerate kinase
MQLDFSGKKALVRVDFNVPLDKQYHITDDTRIREALPTIRHIVEQGGSVILMSHFGRPLAKLKEDGTLNVEKFTLRHVVRRLSDLLAQPVQFAENCIGPIAEKAAAALRPGEVLLLENTRFHVEEEKGNEDFARQLAALADVYVNDAFGSAHRAHASTTIVARFFPKGSKAFGFLMEKELRNAARVLEQPERPLTAIIGGAKVSDKILLLDRLVEFVDTLLIGGAMAYTFFRAQGGATGNSLVEEDKLDLAKNLIAKATARGVKLLLPTDSVVADAFSETAAHHTEPSGHITEGWMGLDIGLQAREDFGQAIAASKTIFWNGPMGVFEMQPFAGGTRFVAEAVAKATQDNGAFSLIGGGDSVAAVNQLGLGDQVSFVSTGGGAMLEFMEGKVLPGVQAIQE